MHKFIGIVIFFRLMCRNNYNVANMKTLATNQSPAIIVHRAMLFCGLGNNFQMSGMILDINGNYKEIILINNTLT